MNQMLDDIDRWFKFDFSPVIQRLMFDALVSRRGNVFFVQVGANDGLTADPIRDYVDRYRWAGLVIEPAKPAFDKLVANYARTDRVACVQALCSSSNHDATFFQVANLNDSLSSELHGVSSVHEEIIRRHFATEAAFRDHVCEVTTRTVTLDEILEQQHVRRIDLLVVDTEGHDLEVLRGFDLRRYLPDLIMLEHVHLGAEQDIALVAILQASGYKRVTVAMDSFFYRPDGIDPEAARVLMTLFASLNMRLSHSHHGAGDTPAAIKTAEAAFAASPNATIASHLGALNFLAGHLDAASRALDAASRFDPQLWTAHLYRSQLFKRRGELPEALAAARQAAKLAPGNAEAAAHLANLERLSNPPIEDGA